MKFYAFLRWNGINSSSSVFLIIYNCAWKPGFSTVTYNAVCLCVYVCMCLCMYMQAAYVCVCVLCNFSHYELIIDNALKSCEVNK